jgi:hypothetical protein
LIAIEERTPAIASNGIAQIVAERGGTRGDHDDPSEMEPVGTGMPAFSQSNARATAQ